MAGPPSLYRKYRPTIFADLVGQEHVTRSIRNALKAGLVSHAYLFSGPRGSGKTSLAKILARAVNCAGLADGEPCGACPACTEAASGASFDVVEIDAASNRKIEHIRELREQVTYAPVGGRKRVYIIDEAHMLTKEASNAFLKTLEEPPPHVIFILCTTEPLALLPTILSRCQRYDFRKLSVDACLKRLEQVVKAEHPLEVTEEARCFLAARGDGSMRDVLSLLDQAVSYCGRTIDRPDLERTLGLVGQGVVERVAAALADGKAGEVVRSVEELAREGIEMGTFLSQLVEHFRALLLVKSGNGDLLLRVVGRESLARLQEAAATVAEPRLVGLLRAMCGILGDVRQGLAPVFALEVGLVAAIHQPAAAAAAPPAAEYAPAPADPSAASRPAPALVPGAAASPPPAAPSAAEGAAPDEERWKRVLVRMRKEAPLTYAFVVEGQFKGRQGEAVLLCFDVRHAFHRSKLQEVKHEALVAKYVAEEFGAGVKPRLVDDGAAGEAAPAPAAPGAAPSARPGKAPATGRAAEAPAEDGRDWYERKALKNRKVEELVEAFDAEVLSVE